MTNRDASQLAGSPQTQQPIRKLVIRHERLRNGYSGLLVRIDDHGQLVLEGSDAGKLVQEVWGADDYDFEQTVPAAWRDTVLLHLMAERFSKTSDFRAWCEERGIPTQFCAWP
jgi:hypothetical protein